MGRADLAEPTLAVAQDCARAFGAAVLLLHVLPLQARRGEEVLRNEAAARADLDTVVAQLRAGGVRVEMVLRFGPVAATIVREARDQQVDLIILSAHRRSPLLSAVRRSVAAALLLGQFAIDATVVEFVPVTATADRVKPAA
jgi:nucleotide-binding universal stress UspA family protein